MNTNPPTSQLMARIPTIPIIILIVPIYQSIPRPTHALQNTRAMQAGRHIVTGHNQLLVQVIPVQGVSHLHGDQMENAVGRVSDADDANVPVT